MLDAPPEVLGWYDTDEARWWNEYPSGKFLQHQYRHYPRMDQIARDRANRAGIAALAQMQAGCHFIAEHPQSSDLWQLPIWRRIAHKCSVARVLVHQCMAGLKGRRSGLPVHKPTEFWASDPLLVAHLHKLR